MGHGMHAKPPEDTGWEREDGCKLPANKFNGGGMKQTMFESIRELAEEVGDGAPHHKLRGWNESVARLATKVQLPQRLSEIAGPIKLHHAAGRECMKGVGGKFGVISYPYSFHMFEVERERL